MLAADAIKLSEEYKQQYREGYLSGVKCSIYSKIEQACRFTGQRSITHYSELDNITFYDFLFNRRRILSRYDDIIKGLKDKGYKAQASIKFGVVLIKVEW